MFPFTLPHLFIGHPLHWDYPMWLCNEFYLSSTLGTVFYKNSLTENYELGKWEEPRERPQYQLDQLRNNYQENETRKRLTINHQNEVIFSWFHNYMTWTEYKGEQCHPSVTILDWRTKEHWSDGLNILHWNLADICFIKYKVVITIFLICTYKI